MQRWWLAAVLGACVNLGCGDSTSHPTSAGGAAGERASAGASGVGPSTSGGTTSGGGATGGAPNGGSAGSSGVSADDACLTRTTNHTAGTRLRYHTLRTVDGMESWEGWYDSQLGVDCDEGRASDGKARCLPRPRYFSSTLYADAACTDAVYLLTSLCPQNAKYLTFDSTTDSCAPKNDLYPVTEPYTGALFSVDGTGNCGAVPAQAPGAVVRRGALIDPAQFVEVQPDQLGSGRIARAGYKSADGAFMVQGYRDTTWNAACTFATLRDGKLHCIPYSGYDLLFSDATCQAPLTTLSTACNQTPSPYFSTRNNSASATGCTANSVVHKAETPFTGTPYGRDAQSASCVEQPGMLSPGTVLYTPSDVPDADVAQAELVTDNSVAGRLKPMHRSSADGSCSFYGLWDSQLGAECTFEDSGADGYRCYPGGIPGDAQHGFSDAGCTTPVDYLAQPTCIADQVGKYVTAFDYTTCGAPPRARSVGAGMVGASASLFSGAPGNCTPIVPGAELTYFILGADVPATDLVKAEFVPE